MSTAFPADSGMYCPGSSSGLHHDFHDNLYVLLRGRKHFELYSPHLARQMYTAGIISKVHANGRIVYEGQARPLALARRQTALVHTLMRQAAAFLARPVPDCSASTLHCLHLNGLWQERLPCSSPQAHDQLPCIYRATSLPAGVRLHRLLGGRQRSAWQQQKGMLQLALQAQLTGLRLRSSSWTA